MKAFGRSGRRIVVILRCRSSSAIDFSESFSPAAAGDVLAVRRHAAGSRSGRPGYADAAARGRITWSVFACARTTPCEPVGTFRHVRQRHWRRLTQARRCERDKGVETSTHEAGGTPCPDRRDCGRGRGLRHGDSVGAAPMATRPDNVFDSTKSVPRITARRLFLGTDRGAECRS